jgi:hypothetical protein
LALGGGTWLFNIKEVGLEETFWSFKTLLTYFDDASIWESITLDKDSSIFSEFIIEFEVVADIA